LGKTSTFNIENFFSELPLISAKDLDPGIGKLMDPDPVIEAPGSDTLVTGTKSEEHVTKEKGLFSLTRCIGNK